MLCNGRIHHRFELTSPSQRSRQQCKCSATAANAGTGLADVTPLRMCLLVHVLLSLCARRLTGKFLPMCPIYWSRNNMSHMMHAELDCTAVLINTPAYSVQQARDLTVGSHVPRQQHMRGGPTSSSQIAQPLSWASVRPIVHISLCSPWTCLIT